MGRISYPPRHRDGPVVTAHNLRKTFDGREYVLDGIDLEVRVGETLVIMGPSGCGKSTLLHHIIGELQPTAGHVELFGHRPARLSSARMDALRLRFGIAFQHGALYGSMTVGENIALPIREHFPRTPESVIRVLVRIKLNQVGLGDISGRYPSEISGGMRKRVAFARAAALDPELLFYDEPTAGLDPVITGVTSRLIRDFSQKLKSTTVVVTHDRESAFSIADRLLLLHKGKVAAEGTPDSFRETDDALVRQFIDGLPDGPLSLQTNPEDLAGQLVPAKKE